MTTLADLSRWLGANTLDLTIVHHSRDKRGGRSDRNRVEAIATSGEFTRWHGYGPTVLAALRDLHKCWRERQ